MSLLVFALLLAAIGPAWSVSNISATNRYAYGANIGWIDCRANGSNGVFIGKTFCAGNAYAADVGWIRFGDGSPVNGVSYANNSADDFGVNVDAQGNLRGFAYGANIGWINFTTNGAPRVNLSTGKLNGFAYGANVGWIGLSNSFAHVQRVSIVTITATDPNASETGGNTGTFTVTRTFPSNATLTVNYTVAGTATPGIDYSNLTGSVTFGANQNSATFQVKPIQNAPVECPETVIATLSSRAHYLVGAANNKATVTITELPVVRVVASDPGASEPGGNTGRFSVIRIGCTNAALQVYYRLGGTATYGSDYTNKPGQSAFVTIPAGQTNVVVTVFPKDDVLVEAAETVTLTLSNRPTYAIGSPANATVTITDNDAAVAGSRVEGRGSRAGAAGGVVDTSDVSRISTLLAQSELWELRIHGADEGLAFVTFREDKTLSGYGLTKNASGVCVISGNWDVTEDGRIEGSYRAQIGDTIMADGSLTAVVGTGKLLAEVSTDAGILKLRGTPASDQPDLSGRWLAHVECGDGRATEVYDVTVREELPGVFHLTGEGAGLLQGAMIATSGNAVSAFMVGESLSTRSLMGRVDSTGQTLRLEGEDPSGYRLRITALRSQHPGEQQ